jgi:hypothetical protein
MRIKLVKSEGIVVLAYIAGSLAIIALGPPMFAQTYEYTSSYAPAPPVAPHPDAPAPAYTADELDQMLGPIALYPDPLLSQVLAASTYPQDVAAAGQWLQYHSNPSDEEINAQPWDPSVKAIARTPEVVKMMADNMDWTEALGIAFTDQQQEVMDSVQRLRAKAQAAQTLISTPQQQVVRDDGVIEILPAQPDVIYVPQYDTEVVYTRPVFAGPFITFGRPCPFGLFFDLGFDFHHHRFLRGVRFDRDRRRFNFDHVRPWEHDPHRRIPPPRHAFFPPRGHFDDRIQRGFGDRGRAPGAFNPDVRFRSRTPIQPRHSERPVTGLSRIPERGAPPRAPQAPGQRSVPLPARPPVRAPSPPSSRSERPVTGLPRRAAPVPRPAPPAPRPAPSPVRPSAPAPRGPGAFHPGGGAGASGRGHGSMHR